MSSLNLSLDYWLMVISGYTSVNRLNQGLQHQNWYKTGLMSYVIVIMLFALLFSGHPNSAMGTHYYEYSDALALLGGSESQGLTVQNAASWNRTTVTYTILNCPATLPCTQARATVSEAIEIWDAASGVDLQPVPSGGDITVQWTTGNFYSNYSFDGPGGILGYGVLPYEHLGDARGSIFLDDSENWATGLNIAAFPAEVDLFAVVLHESGHTLGLPHLWEDRNAVMYGRYASGRHQLTPVDIGAIQAIYGLPD